MKYICFILLFWWLHEQSFAQEKLYYFINEDSTRIGLKNDAWKIIIPAKFTAIFNYDLENPITDSTIEFVGTSFPLQSTPDLSAYPAGEVYDRSGKFLYYPQLYDNDPDYWEEGLRRYVENEKIGFVDKVAKKVIKAQWDFTTPFNYGYAEVYEGGWKKKYEEGGEHWFIVAASDSANSYLINKKGERVEGADKPAHPKDYFFEGEYYPYPFAYNAKERKIVDSLNSLEVLSDISLVHYYSNSKREDLQLQFEIIEYPQGHYPYYVVQGYRQQNKEDDYRIAVSADGKQFYHQPYFSEDGLKPLKEWIIEELEEAKKWMETHKDAPFKFDADNALNEWRKK